MKLAALLFLGAAAAVFAQTPAPPAAPPTKEITVQPSTSENDLIAIYADLDAARKKYNDLLAAARSELDKENKPLQAKIDPIQKQMTDNNQKVGQKFQTDSAPFKTSLQKDSIQIEAIESLVKKEQNLPADAKFDINTGKWVVPIKAPAAPSGEVKK